MGAIWRRRRASRFFHSLSRRPRPYFPIIISACTAIFFSPYFPVTLGHINSPIARRRLVGWSKRGRGMEIGGSSSILNHSHSQTPPPKGGRNKKRLNSLFGRILPLPFALLLPSSATAASWPSFVHHIAQLDCVWTG